MNSAPVLTNQPTVTLDGRLEWERYEEGWNEMVASFDAPPHEYFTYHKERFYELFDNLAFYLNDNPSPRVLEIGVSAFTKLYKVFFPHIRLVTIDRPVALNGFDATFTCGECGAETHYGIDLNCESIGPEIGTEQGNPSLGNFDYVILSEVLEHLVVNPIQLIGELLSLLAPNGLLYLTTPNFFAHYRLQQLAMWDNPQGIFPRRGEDQAAAFHFREYTMSELIDFFTQAGGEIVKAYFSDCWDAPSLRPQLKRTPHFRSDLMVVACLPSAEIAREADVAQWRQYAKPTDLALEQIEIARLRQLVQGYESGRLMRLMNWLHKRGLPHL